MMSARVLAAVEEAKSLVDRRRAALDELMAGAESRPRENTLHREIEWCEDHAFNTVLPKLFEAIAKEPCVR